MKRYLAVLFVLFSLFICSCAVAEDITENIPYTKVQLTQTNIKLTPGSSKQLRKKIYKPTNANDGQWVSSNEDLITVDENGIVTAATGVQKTQKAVVYFVSGGVTLAKCRVTVKVRPVVSVKITPKKFSISPGRSYALKAVVSPSKATYPELTWKSSDPLVASVDENGIITAHALGKTVISATTSNGKFGVCKVTVTNVKVTKLKLSSSKLSLGLNGKVNLTYKVTPEGVGDTSVTWSSSNEEIVSVTQEGTLTGKKAGKASIFITANDGSGIKAKCSVTVVVKNMKSFSLTDQSTKIMSIGDEYTISTVMEPADATYNTITWESSDDTIASVDEKGTVKAHKSGSVSITATTNQGKKSCVKKICVRSTNPKQITISFGGDTILGGDPRTSNSQHTITTHGTLKRFQELLKQNNGDPSFVFKNLRGVFENDDLTVLNLECALTNVKTYKYNVLRVMKGLPEYGSAFSSSGVDAVSIKNNESISCGSKGYTDTKKAIDTYCGGKTRWFDNKNAVVLTRKGARIGLLGVSSGESIKNIKGYIQNLRDDCDILVVFAHWKNVEIGEKYVTTAQQNFAHAVIDAGADILVAAGPHCLQGIELYHDCYIVYSLGNLVTGGNGDKDTIIYQQTFNVYDGCCEAVEQNIIYMCTTDDKSEYNEWCPIILQSAAEKAAVHARLKQYSSVFAVPGIQ